MSHAELIQSLAGLGYGQFLATAAHPRDLSLLIVYAASVGHTPTFRSVTNGTVTVCTVSRPSGGDFFLVESGEREANGIDLADVLMQAGVSP